MVDQDRYPPGVPCWVDTAQPDGPAAARFYGGLFGWDMEDQLPADGSGHYFLARLRGGDVAAVGSLADQAPPTPARGVEHVRGGWRAPTTRRPR